MVLNSPAGYSLLRKSTPIFLQLAAKFPQIWVHNSAISIHHALCGPRHEIVKFVFADTIAALAFGIVPLLYYDTTIHTVDKQLIGPRLLEWVYACPLIVILLLAKINALRVSRLMDQDNATFSELEIQEIERHLQSWKPTINYLDQPSDLVSRLAVQECWRQAVLIYLYMVSRCTQFRLGLVTYLLIGCVRSTILGQTSRTFGEASSTTCKHGSNWNTRGSSFHSLPNCKSHSRKSHPFPYSCIL